MRWSRTVAMIEAHAEGEVGRVVTGGVLDVPGVSMLEKLAYLNDKDDSLRRFLVFEPRGYPAMSTNLVFPPSRPDADAAFIVLQGDRAHAMSGSNAICVTTALLETGVIAMKEPETVVRWDTAAGLVTATATCRNGKCERVRLAMNPSFVHELDVAVDVDGVGKVKCDIAFGGVFYALIDPRPLSLRIEPDQARALVQAGIATHRALNQKLAIKHPELPGIEGIAYTMFVDRDEEGLLGATVMAPGRLDRSPCGTGNSARLAVRYARGEAKPGDRMLARSVIRSRFDVGFLGLTKVAGRDAVLPEITGRGWIHGIHHVGVDPTDPYPQGYKLADIWGDGFDLLK